MAEEIYHVGDAVTAKVEFGLDGGSRLPPQPGRVIYVHPAGRYITVEFSYPYGTFRQSYMLRGRLPGMLGDEEEPDRIPNLLGKFAPHLYAPRR